MPAYYNVDYEYMFCGIRSSYAFVVWAYTANHAIDIVKLHNLPAFWGPLGIHMQSDYLSYERCVAVQL